MGVWGPRGWGTGGAVRVTGLEFPHLSAHPHPHPYLEQDSPVNKLLYAREIPRYKQMVER